MTNTEETWETGEVINWLNGNSGDEWVYHLCADKDAEWLENFVEQHEAPEGLYASFQREGGIWSEVDWEAVAEGLAE